jgi:hypothetical protein
MANVLVFRTNINSSQRVHQAACPLCMLRGICRWSVDLEDHDCVLRIEAESLTESEIIRILTRAGLECSVLD